MNKEKLDLIKDYLKYGEANILIEKTYQFFFKNAIVLPASINDSELNGHYEGVDFLPPTWYTNLLVSAKTNFPIIIIEDIDKINLEQQTKFIEILKYKKISTFELPKNCLIIVTYSTLDTNKINKEVYSLLAHI